MASLDRPETITDLRTRLESDVARGDKSWTPTKIAAAVAGFASVTLAQDLPVTPQDDGHGHGSTPVAEIVAAARAQPNAISPTTRHKAAAPPGTQGRVWRRRPVAMVALAVVLGGAIALPVRQR